MKHFKFVLTMPRNNSWNGKWTGEDKYYCRIRSYVNDYVPKYLKTGDYTYDFGDGWMACVKVEEITAKQKKICNSKSNGFCGYDWMIGSIIEHGKILNSRDR